MHNHVGNFLLLDKCLYLFGIRAVAYKVQYSVGDIGFLETEDYVLKVLVARYIACKCKVEYILLEPELACDFLCRLKPIGGVYALLVNILVYSLGKPPG